MSGLHWSARSPQWPPPMKWLAASLLTVVLMLQYRLWLSADGVREVSRLSDAVQTQKSENDELTERNKQLIAEVADLKAGMSAIEERARSGRVRLSLRVRVARAEKQREQQRRSGREGPELSKRGP